MSEEGPGQGERVRGGVVVHAEHFGGQRNRGVADEEERRRYGGRRFPRESEEGECEIDTVSPMTGKERFVDPVASAVAVTKPRVFDRYSTGRSPVSNFTRPNVALTTDQSHCLPPP